MNTAQLIVLWYAGLITTGVLLVRASDTSSAGYLIAAIALVTMLLLYTLKSHPQARKRRVLLAVLLPVLGVPASVAGYVWYQDYAARREQRPIAHQQIEIAGTVLRQSYGSTHFAARVRNRSPHVLTGLTIQIEITEKGETIEKVKQECYLEVPPGEVRDLEQGVYLLRTSLFTEHGPDPRYGWTFRIIATKGRAVRAD